MHVFSRPVLVISKCLGFEHCRYDGQMAHCETAEELQPFAEFITICPECEVGLGVPREPIRLVKGRSLRLVQPATGLDITEKMQDIITDFLDRLQDVDGFILKSGSPSCGLGKVKVFATADAKDPLHKQGTGLLAKGLMDRFTNIPYADEIALMDPEIREGFLIRVFMYADLRMHHGSIQKLMDFHRRNKLLIMAYDPMGPKVLEKILIDHKQRPFDESVNVYTRTLREITSVPPSKDNIINAFMHALGCLPHKMGSYKKQYMVDCMKAYGKGILTLQQLRKNMIRISEFHISYLKEQTLFYPYPENSGLADQYKGDVNIQHRSTLIRENSECLGYKEREIR
ncbi:YbgA family protein [Methanomethylovorans sp.]|uniref:YbgA family protein n=1 Tax=Methanomethylovorans sp. TaxID=2758717 RepID=UPI00345F14DD